MEVRIVHDSMGAVEVRADRHWGAQTQRSLENFPIGHHRMPLAVIHAFGLVKRACAQANVELGTLDARVAGLIEHAANEVMAGELDEHFPLVVWQTGSGTHTNMNVNEVIARRAALLDPIVGASIHPNDHVNASQSSNDVFPTVMHVAATLELVHRLLPAVDRLAAALEEKAEAFADIIKIGRTHLMDATPLTLGQELGGHAAQLRACAAGLEQAVVALRPIAIGGTAVGTGLNTPAGWSASVARKISALAGLEFTPTTNRFAAIAAHDALVATSAATRTLAGACIKIANDVRLLASGPRCGLGELKLPANEPGSSIMPGKVNPSQCEALTMVAIHVFGNDAAIAFAGSQGTLELNTYKPMMIHNLLESIGLLADACESFRARCVAGIEADRAVIASHVSSSLMLVAALNGTIGYDNAAKVAQEALDTNVSLREAAIRLGLLTEAEFDEIVRPERMLGDGA